MKLGYKAYNHFSWDKNNWIEFIFLDVAVDGAFYNFTLVNSIQLCLAVIF